MPTRPDPPLDGSQDLGLDRPIAEQTVHGSVRFDLSKHSGSFAEGWGNAEGIGCAPGRWAVARRATVSFRSTSTGQPYALKALLRAYAAVPPQHLRLSLNGQPLYTGDVPRAAWLLEAEVPAGALVTGLNRLDFEFAELGQPTGEDTRSLAALLSFIELRPAAAH
jgi:hypothetical protein